MEINGLPLHPLVVHAAVVFGPLGALSALAYVLLSSWRDRLRWPMLGLAVGGGLAIVGAYITGKSFLDSRPELEPLVQTHQTRGELLLLLTLGFSVVAVVAAALHTRTGAVRTALRVLLGVLALAVLVQVVLTGDSGSRAVWGQ